MIDLDLGKTKIGKHSGRVLCRVSREPEVEECDDEGGRNDESSGGDGKHILQQQPDELSQHLSRPRISEPTGQPTGGGAGEQEQECGGSSQGLFLKDLGQD